MRLVGGLNLHLFRREPFYKYAELELNACHLENAKVAISLLTLHPTLGTHQRKVNDVVESTMFGYMQADVAFIEQNCNEIVQQGDLHRKEGNETQAATCYKKAIESLNAVEDREIRHSESFRRVKARSLRKYTQLHSEIHDFADSTAVEALLISMQQLEQSMETCGVYLERVKCMLELGRINVKLFRAASRTFISLDRTTALLEEAYLLGQNLGIPYLSQELRAALGMAYLAVIENAGVETTSKIGCKRLRFLLWMSSGLLANAGSAGMAIKEIAVESDRENVAGESFRLQLEHLAASSSTSRQHDQQRNLIQAAENIASQMQQLPDNWVIVSLMINLSSELVITRFTTNGLSPAVFCLPKADWKHFVCEMNAIIQDSREVLSGHTAEEASSWSIEQKQKWWATREALDKRIEDVMVSMQTMLGFWRCLLVGGSSTFTMENVQRCWELIVSSKTGSRVLMERNQTLLCVIADAQQWLSEDELIDGLKHIAVEMGAPVSDEIVRKALQYLRNKQANLSNLAKLSTERIAKLKVSEIKDLLEAEGLSSDGLKKVLIERLIEARDAVLANDFKSPVDRSRNGMNSQFSTILILHHELQQLPWEGLDIMTHCRGVTRMPSLDLILENVKRSPSIRRDRVRFLLNPAGDLRSTQHQLSPILERGTRTYGWEGIIGQVPDADMLRNYLLAADLYIYCGHGSGEAYLHRDKVLSCQPNCCAALLFGCSSGRLEREGIFGPNGAVLAYLRAGSPGILAMLWDVTDRDIDQLSVKVLQNWLLDCDINTNLSLAQVLQESRDVCKLKYLNGHAAICYGLPLYVTTS
ncbi:hypothetical protein PsorP6_004071 [Peronosclerospora sorghi]|uniref:Uncharacterized protein n=1 Tax=Peronosclerospora sorghi TaxID=230839 RepID=A0ACC0VR54_9STRA|nr:hypothetical protein PsorP6_004071 [Peronosclerospora sorghi]